MLATALNSSVLGHLTEAPAHTEHQVAALDQDSWEAQSKQRVAEEMPKNLAVLVTSWERLLQQSKEAGAWHKDVKSQ